MKKTNSFRNRRGGGEKHEQRGHADGQSANGARFIIIGGQGVPKQSRTLLRRALPNGLHTKYFAEAPEWWQGC